MDKPIKRNLSTQKMRDLWANVAKVAATAPKGFKYTTENGFQYVGPNGIPDCAHDACPECRGTGTKRGGGACIHNIACSCPKCGTKI